MSTALTFEPGAVVVAGGSGGIGEVIARRFAAAGLPVLITCHKNESKAAIIKSEIELRGGRCDFRKVDLSDADAVRSFFRDSSNGRTPIAHVIYASGPHFSFNFIGNIADEEWHHVVNADINGGFHVIQNAVQTFRAQKAGGNLVAIITAAVERVPVKDILSAAPKAALEMLIRGVAKESGRFGIRANCVGPGWINAGIGKRGLEQQLDERAREHIRSRTIPLQRFGEADDIANAVLFLCSHQAAYVTGQSLAVDGGLQL
ncbi:MAG TPA: SDR family oxidoreductase [Steroidobacteraceae bacterium]|nr:SDR family oxidoreductase [Steroidobacteraceae bacterium]